MFPLKKSCGLKKKKFICFLFCFWMGGKRAGGVFVYMIVACRKYLITRKKNRHRVTRVLFLVKSLELLILYIIMSFPLKLVGIDISGA